MGLITGRGGFRGFPPEQHGRVFDEYEAVALPQVAGPAGRDTAVFLRRSARPSRRAVLHLHDLRGSFAPADLARWYNERGFHFYVTDLDVGDPGTPRRRLGRSAHAGFLALDAARRYLLQVAGIDAIILSADGWAAGIAARWCDARRAVRPVDALILSDPEFGRAGRTRMNISCPVLVISAADGRPAAAGSTRHGDLRLGQHVTWLVFGEPAAVHSEPAAVHVGPAVPIGRAVAGEGRRRLFDEMGRWLGAYMYGQLRDQLL